uniref:Uncharacterized protein n=1 Tax=Hucho hucho TaxID=62062 RepID=A0A4W5KGL5_9TELE
AERNPEPEGEGNAGCGRQRAEEHPPSEEKKEVKAEDGGPAPENAHKCCGCHFPLLIALLQLLLGVPITAVAFLMVTISPSLLARETPHWAGILPFCHNFGSMLGVIVHLEDPFATKL